MFLLKVESLYKNIYKKTIICNKTEEFRKIFKIFQFYLFWELIIFGNVYFQFFWENSQKSLIFFKIKGTPWVWFNVGGGGGWKAGARGGNFYRELGACFPGNIF